MAWEEVQQRVVNLRDPREVAEIRRFLQTFQLDFAGDVEYTTALYENGELVGTGSFAGPVLRNIAVRPEYQGGGHTAAMLSQLMAEQQRRGIFHYFLYTRPDKAHLFAGLGFREVARAEPYAVLLETGLGSIHDYCRGLGVAVEHLPAGRRAGLVVNCNPFTLGHRAVIARAAAENAAVVVFVVSEDRSLFPFADRIRLVRAGVADLDNVVVLPGGDYIISQATFPSYFTRGEDTILAQTRLDATIFATHIAPAAGINVRYVGDEPYCAVTAAYNRALAEILPTLGVEFAMMDRVAVANEIISASTVRDLIRREQWEEIRRFVPATTYQYLLSDAAKPVIKKIKESDSRH